MIIGLGTDIVQIARMEKLLQRFDKRFMERCFTKGEQEKGGTNVRFYAKRFAAKEACAKALGTGIAGGILFREIEVVNANSGQPSLVLHGKALERLQAITPPNRKITTHLTLSDEKEQALAVVVIDAE